MQNDIPKEMIQYRFLLILIYVFVLPLSISLLNSFIFSHKPNFALPPFIFSQFKGKLSQIMPIGDYDIDFRKELIKSARFAFQNYYENCVDYDEFRPITNKCLNNYGFSATLFESLETLYMLNMSDEFQKAKNYILNFSFDSRGYINVHEFWSKCIASLIGVFQLSGDASFLFKASELSDQVLNREKRDFVNIKSGKSSDILAGKQFLSNWLSGIPEIILLNKFVQKPAYEEYIKKTVSENPNTFLYPATLNKKKKKEAIYTYFTTSFIKNGKLIESLLKSRKYNKFIPINYSNQGKYDYLKASNNFLKKFRMKNKKRLSELTLASQLSPFKDELLTILLENLENEKRFGDDRYMFGFQFNGDEIFALSKRGQFDIVKQTILQSLNKYRSKNGFCGTTTSSIGKKYPDDIQHTEFLGEWLKIGAMIACGYKFLFQSAIFNECYHILAVL